MAAALAAVEAYLQMESAQDKPKPSSQWRLGGRLALMRGGILSQPRWFRLPRSQRDG